MKVGRTKQEGIEFFCVRLNFSKLKEQKASQLSRVITAFHRQSPEQRGGRGRRRGVEAMVETPQALFLSPQLSRTAESLPPSPASRAESTLQANGPLP